MTTQKLKILVADDNKELRDKITERLKHLDFDVEEVGSGKEALETLSSQKGSFKFASIDTCLRAPGPVYVDLIREIMKIDPKINLIIFSGKLLGMDFVFEATKAGVSRFVYKQKGINELQKVITNIMSETHEESSHYLFDFLKEKETRSQISHFDCFVDDPFEISFDEYLAFKKAERKILQLRAREDNADWIENELAKRKARWLLVIGKDCVNKQVIAHSANLKELPKPAELRELAKKYNHFPYVFISSPLIEENQPAARPIPWVEIQDSDDFFPTLEIYVGRDDWEDKKVLQDGLRFVADFDTGAAEIFLNYEQLEKARIIRDEDIEILNLKKGYHINRKYDYVNLPIRVCIQGSGDHIVSEDFQAFCVENWEHEDSPFKIVNPAREALVGRSLLRNSKFSLRLELNGEERFTKVY